MSTTAVCNHPWFVEKNTSTDYRRLRFSFALFETFKIECIGGGGLCGFTSCRFGQF